MMISTRGRYALRVMIDLAENGGGGYVPLKEVAVRQELSLKYIEKIIPSLVKAGYVEGIHGKGGGYKLVKPSEEYTVLDILRLAEGDLAPVSCLGCKAKPCPRAAECKTLPMWKDFYGMVDSYFSKITIKDIINGKYHPSRNTENRKSEFRNSL